MEKLSTFIFLAVLVLSSCTKQALINNELEPLKQHGYFPLHVGNTWEYVDGSTTVTDVLETMDGKEYFRFIKTIPDREIDTTYYRSEGNNIFEKSQYGVETFRFNLDADIDDSWIYKKYSDGYTPMLGFLKDKKAMVETDNFTFDKCHEFFYDQPQIADEEHSIFLAEGIGIVRRTTSWVADPGKALRMVTIDGTEVIFE